jgi:tetratricopeptide (TPR) repeat protein
MGRLKEAAESYVKVAEIYLGRKDVGKAIGNWERASRLSPGLLDIHSRLALAYERTGKRKSAVREYLTIAAIFQRRDDANRAIQACERARRLDKNNPQVLNALQALQAGQKMRGVAAEAPKPEVKPQRQGDLFTGPSIQLSTPREATADELKGPAGEAQEIALSALATHLFESGLAVQDSGKFASQGIDLQRAGELGAAIAAYRQAKSTGLNHPAFSLCLGSLLVEYGEYQEGIQELKGAVRSRSLAAGAYFAMAEAFMATDNQREAIRHLLSSLKLVDVGGHGKPSNTSVQIYTGMLRNAAQMDESRLSALNQSLHAFMTGPNWKRNVAETRDQLEEAARLDGEAALLEMLATDQTGRVAAIMSRIDSYRRQSLSTLAMDEAHYALQIAPTYLPAHTRIAQILLTENRMRPAIDKYNMVAEVYRARGDNQKAAEILAELLKMAPMDVSVRRKRMQWLEEEERWDELLDEYINLADNYYQLADWDSARETYEQAERVAQELKAPQDKFIYILHRVADIHIQRLDMREAIRVYARVKKIAPDNEFSRRTLIDLHYRVGDNANAVGELDDLLRLYAQKRRIDLITGLLEELVTRHPDEMALRSRLARVYQQQRKIKEAVAQLDALGELQLEAGLHNEAVGTIQTIIKMNPPDRESYEQLLTQLR